MKVGWLWLAAVGKVLGFLVADEVRTGSRVGHKQRKGKLENFKPGQRDPIQKSGSTLPHWDYSPTSSQ